MGAELIHAERQKGMTKLMVVFGNFTNAHKNDKCLLNFPLFESII